MAPPTVLLIEDNPADARLMREALAELGAPPFSLRWEQRLSSGLETLAAGGIDLVLLDLSLPDSDGLDGLHAIGNGNADVPVVVLTGLRDEEVADRALREGAQDYLFKGQVTGDVLARAVRYAIERHRADQELRQRELQLRQLQLVSDSALAHLGLEELLDDILDRVMQALGGDVVALLLADEERGELIRQAARGMPAVYEGRVRIGEGFSGTIAATRKAMIIEDTETSELTSGFVRECGIRSTIGAPLLVRDRLEGVLHVGMCRPQRFSASQVRLLELVADRVALAVENARLYRELRQAVDLRDHLLAVAAHDLRNPLASIGMRIQAWRVRASGASAMTNDQLAEQMVQIERAAGAMAHLIDDLMDAAHLQLGRALVLNCSRLELGEMVRSVTRDFERSPGAEGHPIVLREADAPIYGLWDQPRLERVLRNLLENATKYSPRGSEVVVAVTAEDDEQGRHLGTFSVTDHGIGVPDADLPLLFQRFHRASNVGTTPGTGIGLAGARQIVEQHSGRIDVLSREGEGSTFTVRLPVEQGMGKS